MGPIAIGDEIAPSDLPGVGRKAGHDQSIVGLAMENWPPPAVGKIMVFIKLGRTGADPAIQKIQEVKIDSLASSTILLEARLTTLETAPPSALGFFSALFERFISWLADAANGIREMFADTFRAKEKVCIGATCINEEM